MTAARFARRNHGGGHSYLLDGEKVPGVTTVIGALDKPALINWAARQAAELAVNDWDRLATLPIAARLQELQWAHRATNRKAATRGTRIHTFGEHLAHGREVNVPDELRGPVEAYARFLDLWGIESTAIEVPVCHTEYRYAGTADGFVTSPRLGPILLDVKTGSGVFPEVALQLSAYRYANLALIDNAEAPVPEVAACYVAHVLPDDVELVPVSAGETEWRAFLYLQAVHRWRASVKDDPPIGDVLRPENLVTS